MVDATLGTATPTSNQRQMDDSLIIEGYSLDLLQDVNTHIQENLKSKDFLNEFLLKKSFLIFFQKMKGVGGSM